MEQEAVYFKNGIIKSACHKNKKLINIDEVDIEEIVLPHKKSYGKDSFKYFVGYRHKGNAFPSALCVKRPQMNAYAKYFDKNSKDINLSVNDKEILEKYFEIWNKIKSLVEKEFNNEPVYNDKCIKTKIKIFNDRVYTNFQHNKIPKGNEYCACLSVIRFCFFNSGKEYYLQIFLEECKYAIKNKKIVNTINKDSELSESDESDDECDKEIIIPYFKKFLWI